MEFINNISYVLNTNKIINLLLKIIKCKIKMWSPTMGEFPLENTFPMIICSATQVNCGVFSTGITVNVQKYTNISSFYDQTERRYF